MTTVELSLIGGVIIALACSVFALVKVQRMARLGKTLFEKVDGRNALAILNECLEHLDQMNTDHTNLRQDLERAHDQLLVRISQPVMKRYNSFGDVGGNQSFSLALLDASNTGVIISALHGRQGASMYAKWVDAGKPLHNLSDEEAEVLQESIKRV